MCVCERKNLKSALESAILYLQKKEIQEARNDAWLLLEHVCGISHSTYFVHSEEEMPEEQQKEFEALIKKRGEHIPLQQLTGEAWFYGIPFFVNEHVLIPRQDTEILVEEALRGLPQNARILDLCTGSGCILTSLLVTREDCTGIGADLSEEALKVAEKNGVQAGGRASFVKSDLFEKIEGTFDVIASNPPYIRTDVIETLMLEVRDHEPRMALDGSADGLVFYRKITEQAGSYLKESGKLCFEIGYDQGGKVRELMENHGFSDVQVLQDLAGLDRVVTGTWHKKP